MSQRYDFILKQGATLGKSFNVFLDGEVFDLEGYEARFQAREKTSDTTPVISLTSVPAAGLTITAGDGLIELAMTPTQTAALVFINASFNLEIYTALDAEVYRILEGVITLDKEDAK